MNSDDIESGIHSTFNRRHVSRVLTASARDVKFHVDVLRFELEQGSINIIRNAAPASKIEVHGVLGGGGGDVQSARAKLSGPRHCTVEECASHTRFSLLSAHMEELQL